MWPRGHISNCMRSASFGLCLLRQCERRRPRCTLLPDQLDFARGRRRMHGSVHGRRDPCVRSRARISCASWRAWGRHMRCLAMAVAIGLALRGMSLAADPRFPDWPCNQIKVPEISVAAYGQGRRSTTSETLGRKMPRSGTWSRGLRRAARRSMTRRRPSQISSRAANPSGRKRRN